MLKPLYHLFLIYLLLICCSCSVQYEDDLLLNSDSCTSSEVSFSKDIISLLDRNCFSCHSNGTNTINGNNIDLDGYKDLLEYIEAGTFLGAIKHENDFSPMPQNGNKLSICSITKIETWITNGYPQN